MPGTRHHGPALPVPRHTRVGREGLPISDDRTELPGSTVDPRGRPSMSAAATSTRGFVLAGLTRQEEAAGGRALEGYTPGGVRRCLPRSRSARLRPCCVGGESLLGYVQLTDWPARESSEFLLDTLNTY